MVLKNIFVKGAKNTTISEISSIVSGFKGLCIEDVDLFYIKDEIIKLPFVKDVNVIKRYPDTLILDMSERKIIFVTYDNRGIDDEFSIVDFDMSDRLKGQRIIKISGKIDRNSLKRLLSELDYVSFIRNKIVSLRFISGRRWDSEVSINGRIFLFKLPEDDVRNSLNRFLRTIYKTDFLSGPFSIIDLRAGNMVVY
jgi:cell division septal protein FtsQ